jgi:hypothetical protein
LCACELAAAGIESAIVIAKSPDARPAEAAETQRGNDGAGHFFRLVDGDVPESLIQVRALNHRAMEQPLRGWHGHQY